MISDEKLSEIISELSMLGHFAHDPRVKSTIKKTGDAIFYLRTENSELRAGLAVFTEGMPSSYHLDRLWNLAVLKDMEYCARWIGRIASANEVPNAKP